MKQSHHTCQVACIFLETYVFQMPELMFQMSLLCFISPDVHPLELAKLQYDIIPDIGVGRLSYDFSIFRTMESPECFSLTG